MKKYLLFALAFVLTIASCSVMAEKPPIELVAVMTKHPVVHDQTCNFHEEKNVECLIFYDAVNEVAWIALFDGEPLDIYKVIFLQKEGKETIVWCRQTRCI